MCTAERPAEAQNHKFQHSGNTTIEKAAMSVVDVEAKVTVYVVRACAIAASGGVLFGYDGENALIFCTVSNDSVYWLLLSPFRL